MRVWFPFFIFYSNLVQSAAGPVLQIPITFVTILKKHETIILGLKGETLFISRCQQDKYLIKNNVIIDLLPVQQSKILFTAIIQIFIYTTW